ncbi:MAG: hypothetical protein PUP90_11595 [Nostoc sp. S4]|nr:hypothetical protein [Nostoc sp. S4]
MVSDRPEAIASTKKQSDYYCLQQLVSHCWSCSGVVGAQFEQSLLSLL